MRDKIYPQGLIKKERKRAISMTLSKEVIEKLKQIADAENRSISQVADINLLKLLQA